MHVEYGNLIAFANTPTYNNMAESRLLTQIFTWIGDARDEITADYWFTVTYIFSGWGQAIDASILVQFRNSDGSYENLGSYSPLGNTTLLEVIGAFDEENCEECTPSDKPSLPRSYYVPGYYVPDYYVDTY